MQNLDKVIPLAICVCAGVLAGEGGAGAFQADLGRGDGFENTGSPAATATAAGKPGTHDGRFLSQASQAGAQEVSDARLALMMTRREDVKQVAQMLHQDHSDANQRLVSLLKVKGWPAPAPVDLAPGPGANGSYSDAQFIGDQIAAHQQAITLFEQEISAGEDRDLRAFAQATLPNLRHHLVVLQALGSA